MTERTTVSPYHDPYTRSADHLELLSSAAWESMAPTLSEALSTVDSIGPTVVELGAGTGLGTEVVAHTLPDAHIVAVEPSSHLRAALMQRIISRSDLRSRVTVESRPFPSSRIPEKFDALVMINSLGHLDADTRGQLWQTIASSLHPRGCAVVNLQQPTTASTVPEFEMARERVGHREYHGSAWAERVDDGTMLWHMTYRTSQDGVVLDTVEVEYRWNVLNNNALTSELTRHRLRANPVGDGQAGLYRIVRE